MSGSEIVHQAAGMATLPLSDPPKTFLLPFSKNQHLVPESAIISFPKKANKVASPEALGALLATKAPEKWLQYCKPNTLCRIQGETGNCVYTTFQVDGHPGEERILRNIAPAIAEKNFKEIKLTDEDDCVLLKGDNNKIFATSPRLKRPWLFFASARRVGTRRRRRDRRRGQQEPPPRQRLPRPYRDPHPSSPRPRARGATPVSTLPYA